MTENGNFQCEGSPVLQHQCRDNPTDDVSKKGLGVCLIQNGKVFCYASRALTKTEQNYQNLE